MRRETKERIKTGWYRFCSGVKELAPWFALGSVGGMIVGGYVGAIENGKQIIRINKRLDGHEQVINYNADVVDHNAEQSRKDRERIEELERRQALLMEQSLKEIAGK